MGSFTSARAWAQLARLVGSRWGGDEFCKERATTRQETVKAALNAVNSGFPVSGRRNPAARKRRSDMSILMYIVLTVAIFALLGWIQKLVERL